MHFGSVCSGIEAASVAWHPIGWKAAWLAEIEPFPSAVLAHHYPDVPNLGDMTTISRRVLTGEVSAPDVFCGGTPCQAFSVAGLRESLADERGNLTLKFVEIADAIDHVRAGRGEDECIVFWENVPGVLSTKDNAFGCFLAGLAGEDGPLEPPGGKWANAGAVYGPKRAVAWRTLDAQYFGVAQRRRRVFVVASARKGFDPATVLFEWDGVRRDTAPSREARQVAPTIPARSTAGGGLGTDFDCDGGTICVATGQAGAEIGADMAPTLNCNHEAPYVAHSLRGEGFDASEDGTGRGTPWVPVAMINMQGSKGNAVAQADGPSFTLNAMHGHDMHAVAVPVGVTIHGTDPTVQKVASYDELAQCLRARTPGNIDNSSTTVVQQPVAYGIRTANTSSNGWGVQEECTHTLDCAQGVAVAFQERGRTDGPSLEIGGDVAYALTAPNGGGRAQERNVLTPAMQVRRLTPVECERLQGFPTVSEKITIQACLDHQNQSVRVALKCLRWQNSALSAEESALTQPAKTAAVPSSTSPAHLAPLAALHVRMYSVDELLEIRSAGRLIWSVSGAGQSERSLPPTLTENSVQELARLLREVARTITAGKAESPPSIRLSFPASSGAINAEKSGREMEESASDAMSDQHRATFTTSDLGLITTFSDSTAETLSCFALHAIAGCIPSTTLPETFSIEMTVETPYTAIPWRGKPADQCPDGPRYKALGNSWAIPCVSWIGKRIQVEVARG